MRLSSFVAAPALFFVFNSPGMAAELKPIATIAIPGVPVDAFGAIFVDSTIHRAFLTDRSNKAIDVIDTAADKFLSRVTGFVGVGASGNTSGPQGVVTTDHGTQVWATDGDSTVKVIDLAAGKIVDSISTGGKLRTGELAYDPRDKIVLATNPGETPQFVTLISTEPGHRIIAKIILADATEGLERPAYSPQSGLFYVPVPSLDAARTAGGLAVIDPRQGKLITLYRTDHCNPHSIAILSEGRAFIRCNYGAPDSAGDKGQLASFDLIAGKIVAIAAGLGGDGQTAVDVVDGQYYFYAAANKNPGGPVLKVVDVHTLGPVQTITTWAGSHSVGVSSETHRVYLPTLAKTGPCGGCVEVYAPTQ
jgi:hypothetical protein